ncbi:replicative DNA helicase [Paenibacillus uliginis N3/975]|uniref:DNA 5'-3' helicase n=2 Tax=Paenibacillus TaxID=44249 RepID=A0A1X7HKQ7_9BACL|nr:replicative DNA helicase [Paenibacillus uliginis N3/975]
MKMNDYNYLYEAEINVLGSIMLDKTLMDDCVLMPESFSPAWDNGKIFEVLKYAYKKFSDQPDPFYLPLLAQHWGKKVEKIGGFSRITEIQRSVPHTNGMFRHYQQIVNDEYVQREMKDAAELIATGKTTLQNAKARMEELEDIQARTSIKDGPMNLSDLLERHTSIIIKRSQHPGGVTGRKSCSTDYNNMSKGHQNGDFIVVGARPSVGKSAYLCNEAYASSEDGSTSFIVSGEDGAFNMLERMIGAVGRVKISHMKSGQMTESDWERYSRAADLIGERKIFIDDSSGPTIEHIWRTVRRMVKLYPKMTLYIDYLQHLRSEKNFTSEREMYKYISYQLKQIARTLMIPVVCLAAVGRSVDQRQDKRPMMSDIRDCGNIESDADIVIFLYRDDYYNADSARKGLIDLIVAKGRNVGTGTITMVFDKPYQSFLNITEEMKQKRKEKGLSA